MALDNVFLFPVMVGHGFCSLKALLSNVGPHAEEGKEHGLGIEPKK
jgi:hypothetical protein